MLFDERVQRALEVLREQRASFRGAVTAAHDQVRGFLATHGVRTDSRAREAALELGQFAGGRIDGSRFAAVVTRERSLAPDAETTVRRCAEVLDEVLAQGDALFVCEVPRGGDLRACVEDALAEAGRAFGAALVFQSARTGVRRAEPPELPLRAFPFSRWNRAERLLAPPLIVSVAGADLHAGGLAEYMEGGQRIVLLVEGPCAPAPLVRLVTPGTFVLQAHAEAELAALAAAAGPGVAALLASTAVRFTHDPAAERRGAPRLAIHAQGAEPRHAVGGWSAWQQREELAQLRALAATPPAVSAAPAPAPAATNGNGNGASAAAAGAVDPVDALASWLLAQAGGAS